MAVEQNTSQIDRLVQMSPDSIPRGCTLPIPLVRKFFKRGVSMELGAGGGEKTKILEAALKNNIFAVEINPRASSEAHDRGLFSITADARRIDLFSVMGAGFFCETHRTVFIQGLLCNQINNDWEKIIKVAHIILGPGGRLFIADVFQADTPNITLPVKFRTESKYFDYIEKWNKRYEYNQQAAQEIGIQIARGDFMVAKPGPNKNRLDWGDVDTLCNLYQSDQFERWASHVHWNDMTMFMRNLGFKLLKRKDEAFYSRSGMPLNGEILIYEKGPVYEYHPWYKGCTPDNHHQQWKKRQGAVRNENYIENWIREFLNNLGPQYQDLAPSLVEYLQEIDQTS